MSSEDPKGDDYPRQWEPLAGWFLGPRAENRIVFNDLMLKALNWHENRREEFFPADPCYFTEEFRNSDAATAEYKDLETKMHELHQDLNKSIPFFSTRYQGHMTWDTTMPAMLGYVSGLLWNQNNVDSTASPVTTQFEVEVGNHLCTLMRFPSNENITPWGHLTGCGSVANIESMWAARNTKFHPLALQEACNDGNFSDLSVGGDTPVYVPGQGKELPLRACTKWDLLNLEIDVICSLTDNVVAYISQITGTAKDDVKSRMDKALESHSLVQIGLPEFYRRHGIGEPSEIDPSVRTYPRVLSPGTNHYSWPKSSTILGIGDSNVIPIQVDGKARQNIDELKKELDFAVKHKIAVMMVVAVIGTTEESAVDDIHSIINLKSHYASQGLTFSVHADSAWGGYLNCMTHGHDSDSASEVYTNRLDAQSYVPTIPLSPFVEKQYRSLKFADTVTIDPHKAGFCPYPAGALLYRNGTMKGFITLAAPEVFHNPNDLNVGVYGLEGSKPGAAACGVLLSHRVIGLDKNGYGRILGQCQLGSKLFYSLWETVAKASDPFICVNFIAPDLEGLTEAGFTFQTEDDVRTFIQDHILGKQNEVLYLNRHREMDFLKIVGPDALINSFVVNCLDETGSPQDDVNLVNDLQNLIFNELTSSVGEDTKRVLMFLTTSQFALKNYGEALQQLKTRLGLPTDNEDSLGFLRNTCMEPYQASGEYVLKIGELFRNTVLNCIGALDATKYPSYGDPLDYHSFLVVNKIRGGKVFLDFRPTFTNKQSQYQSVFRIIVSEEYRAAFKEEQDKATGPLFLETTSKVKLFDFIKTNTETERDMKLVTISQNQSTTVSTVKVKIDEVWAYRHFETPETAEYNEKQQYFMYGDEQEAFLSHIIAKQSDFYQVLKLDSLPHSVPHELLDLGCVVTLPEVDGVPLVVEGKIIDPLFQTAYTGEYRGRQYAQCVTSLLISNADAKIYFDVDYLNGASQSGDSQSGKGGKGHGQGGKGHGQGHGHGKKK